MIIVLLTILDLKVSFKKLKVESNFEKCIPNDNKIKKSIDNSIRSLGKSKKLMQKKPIIPDSIIISL